LSDVQPNSPVFFLDKNHGLMIREMLRSVGIRVFAHKDFGWRHDLSDIEIIHQCAEKGYAIISGDKAMARVPHERQAIIDGKCKVFMFDDTGKTRTEDWIASILVGRQRLVEIVQKTNGPLFVTIKACRAKGHIGRPDFVEKAGGGWRSAEEVADIKPMALEHPNQPKARPQQGKFEFPSPKN